MGRAGCAAQCRSRPLLPGSAATRAWATSLLYKQNCSSWWCCATAAALHDRSSWQKLNGLVDKLHQPFTTTCFSSTTTLTGVLETGGRRARLSHSSCTTRKAKGKLSSRLRAYACHRELFLLWPGAQWVHHVLAGEEPRPAHWSRRLAFIQSQLPPVSRAAWPAHQPPLRCCACLPWNSASRQSRSPLLTEPAPSPPSPASAPTAPTPSPGAPLTAWPCAVTEPNSAAASE
jgi:hypothetical protein